MSKSTASERALALRMERDRAKQERLGVHAGARLGFQLFSGVIAAYKGGRDPIERLDSLFKRTTILVRDSMVASHLAGMQRTITFYENESKPPLQLATNVYGESIKALRRRIGLSKAKVEAITVKYGPEATRIVAGAKASVQKTLQKDLLEIQLKGLHVRDGVKELSKSFKKLGITPTSSYTLENIFRTQTQIAYSAGRWQADQDPAIQEILWGYKYVTVGDARVRLNHVGLDGVTLPKDDPRWDNIFPPNGFSCRCTAIPVFEERKIVEPKDTVIVGGQKVIPSADAGFNFNPGKVFSPPTSPPLSPIPKLPKPPKPVTPEPKPTVAKSQSAWERDLLDEQSQAILDYTLGHSDDIRLAQKSGVASSEVAKQLKNLDDAYATAPKYNGNLYRGLTLNDDVLAASFNPGNTFESQAWMSTSSKRNIAKTFMAEGGGQTPVLLEFKAVKNTGMSIRNLSDLANEFEVLVPQKSKFEIVSRKLIPAGTGPSAIGEHWVITLKQVVKKIPKPKPIPKLIPKPKPTPKPTPKPAISITEEEWINSLSKKEASAVRVFTGNSYKVMRAAQKTGTGTPLVKARLEAMEEAYRKAPKYSGTVQRGMTLDIEEFETLFKVGGSFETGAWTSTSTLEDVAVKYLNAGKGNTKVLLRIEGLENTGMSVRKLSGFAKEAEVILPKGVKLDVISIKHKTVTTVTKTGKLVDSSRFEVVLKQRIAGSQPVSIPSIKPIQVPKPVQVPKTILTEDTWVKVLPDDQMKAIKSFTDIGYNEIRMAQITGDASKSVAAEIKALDNAYKTAPKHSGTLHRGLTLDDDVLEAAFNIGNTFESQAWMSTTTKKEVAKKFLIEGSGETAVLLKFENVKDIGMSVKNLSHVKAELEVMIPQGTQFKIIGKTWIKSTGTGEAFTIPHWKITLKQVAA